VSFGLNGQYVEKGRRINEIHQTENRGLSEPRGAQDYNKVLKTLSFEKSGKIGETRVSSQEGMMAKATVIPDHLQPFIAAQEEAAYTATQHEIWRFIMRISKAFFKDYAHEKYLAGLEATGISIDEIPSIAGMDAKLQELGWRAVPVSGFIPPSVFMEFQSMGILPIAREMRVIEHIAYTPAPDIVHEAAGHAPIIADPAYAEYLRRYGEVARKAIISHQDMSVYEAIRELSDVKERPEATEKEIEDVQNRLDRAVANSTYVSESAYLARTFWWTVEYGLVGDLHDPKIYGAGLLSSVGESYACLGENVDHVPLTLDAVNMSYDITKPQPQLYVTPSFAHLTKVLEDFEKTMAFKVGGVEGLSKALMAQTVVTSVFDSGLQVSGKLGAFRTDAETGEATYLQFSGPCQLSIDDQQMEGHGVDCHPEGFGSPVGELKGEVKNPADLRANDLMRLGFTDEQTSRLEFESGVVVEGVLKEHVERKGKTVLLSFRDCTVTLGSEILFRPEWGAYDMACGASVPSVFGGAADRREYLIATHSLKPSPQIPPPKWSKKDEQLASLFEEVRSLRESGAPDLEQRLNAIYNSATKDFSETWLLFLSLLETDHVHRVGSKWKEDARRRVEELKRSSEADRMMIERGLSLISD
jgi:phenylalanine-4-hydroxylase